MTDSRRQPTNVDLPWSESDTPDDTTKLIEWGKMKRQIARMEEALRESLSDNAWNAYHCGVTKEGGKWMDGGMSDAEWLRREMDLGEGWHDCAMIQKRIPEVVERKIANLKEISK